MTPVGATDFVLATLLSLVGLAAFVLGRLGMRPALRVRRERTRTVAEVAPGIAEVAGTFHAKGAGIKNYEGAACIAVLTRISRQYTLRGKKHSSQPFERMRVAEQVELHDAVGGVCDVSLVNCVLFGGTGTWWIDPVSFEKEFPEFVSSVPGMRKSMASEVQFQVDQVFVQDQTEGWVSGRAVPGDTLTPGDGYRGSGRRWKIEGEPAKPIIVATQEQNEVLWRLRRPSRLFTWLAVIALGSAGWVLWRHYTLDAIVRGVAS